MMLSLLATSLLFISADLASARGWRARRRVDVHMGEDIGKAEGVENFTLPSFADFKADFDANLNRDPDFERWLFGGKQSTSTMSDWLRQQRTPWQPWQANNWSTVINQATANWFPFLSGSPLKELAAMYRSQKTSWMRERLASWQAHLKIRYIAAWYLERMLPRHEALWEAARVCPCRSVLDGRCPRGSNCYGQRLAAGYFYDKDGNPKIRTCYTVPGTTVTARAGAGSVEATAVAVTSGIEFPLSSMPRGGFGRFTASRAAFGRFTASRTGDAVAVPVATFTGNHVEEAEEELSCTDRVTHADFLKAEKILLANIRDDKGNSVPDVTATAVASTDPAAAPAAAAATAANNWDWRHSRVARVFNPFRPAGDGRNAPQDVFHFSTFNNHVPTNTFSMVGTTPRPDTCSRIPGHENTFSLPS